MSNSYIIYRIEPDGSETPISYVGDEMEIPGAIVEDQEMTDYYSGNEGDILINLRSDIPGNPPYHVILISN